MSTTSKSPRNVTIVARRIDQRCLPTYAHCCAPRTFAAAAAGPPRARKGFVLVPRRWGGERSFAWFNRFRRLARDYERLASTLAGLHMVAAICLMLQRLCNILTQDA